MKLPLTPLLSGFAALAAMTFSGAAGAAPSFQLFNSIPADSAQAMTSFGAMGVTTAFTSDGAPDQPWLIALLNADASGAGSMQRRGPVGLLPTTPLTEVYFPGEAHPLAVIVGMSDGYVYRWDGDTGECVWKTYIGRTSASVIHFPGCTGSVAPSAIQCPNEGDSTIADIEAYFDPSGTAATTTFFVPTAYAAVSAGDDPSECGGNVGNRLYALDGATGAPHWVFNGNADATTPYAVDAAPPYSVSWVAGTPIRDLWDDGCSGGVNREQIILATSDPGTGSGQDTLFAVSASAATGGALNWSGNAGDVQTALAPGVLGYSTCHHIYAATATGGNFETIGISADVCGAATVPCFVAPPLHVFLFTSPIGDPQVIYDATGSNKVVVADQSTVHVLTDRGASVSTFCNGSSLQTTFPTLTSVPKPYGSSIWFGAKDRTGNGAIVGLELPASPAAGADCGTKFAASFQGGTVGPLFFDGNPTNPAATILETVVTSSGGSHAVIGTFTE